MFCFNNHNKYLFHSSSVLWKTFRLPFKQIHAFKKCENWKIEKSLENQNLYPIQDLGLYHLLDK